MAEARKMRIAKTRPAILKPDEAQADPNGAAVATRTVNHDSTHLAGPLQTGDKIEFSVTHEIDADGDKAWVRYGVTSTVLEHETPVDASVRVVEFVKQTVIDAANQVARQIMER